MSIRIGLGVLVSLLLAAACSSGSSQPTVPAASPGSGSPGGTTGILSAIVVKNYLAKNTINGQQYKLSATPFCKDIPSKLPAAGDVCIGAEVTFSQSTGVVGLRTPDGKPWILTVKRQGSGWAVTGTATPAASPSSSGP